MARRVQPREVSPWRMCEACERCAWWTGWVCRNEPTGFRDCPAYGIDFVMHIVARDRVTGRAKLVPLKKGQTAEDFVRAAAKPPVARSETGVDFLGP
jgi:hypothetical protein